MSTSLFVKAQYPTEFPLQMLRDIALLSTPHLVAQEYGFDYDELVEQPHFKAQLARVDAELFHEGHVTRAMAEVGLAKAVTIITERVVEAQTSGRMSNDDLNKFTNTLHKVTNRDKEKDGGPTKPMFSIEINLGGSAGPITITSNQPTLLDTPDEFDVQEAIDRLELDDFGTSVARDVAILDEIEVEEMPSELIGQIMHDNDFSLEVD